MKIHLISAMLFCAALLFSSCDAVDNADSPANNGGLPESTEPQPLTTPSSADWVPDTTGASSMDTSGSGGDLSP